LLNLVLLKADNKPNFTIYTMLKSLEYQRK